jgi:hypothetical protein
MGFVEQASRKIVDESKDLVRFAYATGRHLGLGGPWAPTYSSTSPIGQS